MAVRGGELVARTLKGFGVRRLFSLPGHQILSVFDACIDEGLDLVSTRHEASAVFMAQAVAYATRDVGVAVLAGGPELTNALTAIAQAYFSHTPLLVVAGANTLQKRDRGFPQDMDQLSVVRPFTKWARSCHDIRRIPEYVATAYRHAVRGRPGPTYLEIPYDVLESHVREGRVSLPSKPEPVKACAPIERVEALARLLEEARRPIVLAGSGVLWARAETELRALVERTGIPLLPLTGALTLPLPRDLVYAFGSPGLGRPAMRAIAEADVVVLLGTRVNFQLGFGEEPFMPSAEKIAQVDVEAEEIDANRPVDLALTGDVGETLRELNRALTRTRRLDAWRATLEEERIAFEKQLEPLRTSEATPIHPLRLVDAIEGIRAPGSALVLDGANSVLWALLGCQRRRIGGLLLSASGDLQAIGAGVPHAIATKLADPERQVILHSGDGSFGYGAIELETAVRHRVPIVVVVHNDGGWGMTRDMQVEFFGADREIGNRLGIVRYDRMVEALGGYGEFVEAAGDLEGALHRALECGRPACVNVVVDPKPRSPGLEMFMLMEVMLGKQTPLDRVPEVMGKLREVGLDRAASRAMRTYLEARLHRKMR